LSADSSTDSATCSLVPALLPKSNGMSDSKRPSCSMTSVTFWPCLKASCTQGTPRGTFIRWRETRANDGRVREHGLDHPPAQAPPDCHFSSLSQRLAYRR